MATTIQRVSTRPGIMKSGMNVRTVSVKMPDGSYKAYVDGQDHILSATAPVEADAVRELSKLVRDKYASGNLQDYKQTMI